MNNASINDIRKTLLSREPHELTAICLRMAKYKKENKELLSYILYDSGDEQAYIENLKLEVDDLFDTLVYNSAYKYTKQVRKILRYINKHIKYSGLSATQVELLVFFCEKLRKKMRHVTALENIYAQQLKKIDTALSKLHEDVQYDYARQVEALRRFN